MATTCAWQGRDGDRREETLFIDVTVWERQAENCCQYLRKGSSVHVEGSLRMDSWEDKTTGEKRSKIRVNAERVQFLDSRRGDGTGPASDDDYGSSSPSVRDAGSRPRAASNRGGAAFSDSSGGSNGPAGADMHVSDSVRPPRSAGWRRGRARGHPVLIGID